MLASKLGRSFARFQPQTCRNYSQSSDLILRKSYDDDRTIRLVMNNPKKRNALSMSMLTALHDQLSEIAATDRVHSVIIAGQPPAFCSGHDLKELTTKTGKEYHKQVFDKCSTVMNFIQAMGSVVIAEVDGPASAAGCQLALSCDMIVASEKAKFLTPGGKVAGIFCHTPGIPVVRQFPVKVAMDMLLTGDPVSAEQAYQHGVVSRLVSSETITEDTLSLSSQLAALSHPVIIMGKAFVHTQKEQPLARAYKMGETMMVENLRLVDTQEGIDAFVSKRKPNWKHGIDTAH